MLMAENIVLDIGENYIKQSYRTRYNIFSASGKYALTIPVSRPGGNHSPVKDILISDHEPWQRTHFRTIKTAYQNSPYYIHYIDEIEALLNNSNSLLYQYNDFCLKGIMEMLSIPITYTFTDEYIRDSHVANDFRNQISPKKENHLTNTLISNQYHQVFEDSQGYIADLSILDILFNLGPESTAYLTSVIKNIK